MSEFWKRMEDYKLTVSFFGCTDSTDIEEMYQEFKIRLINELSVESPELLERASIVDIGNKNDK